MLCHVCHWENRPGAAFCRGCGRPIPHSCSGCGRVNPATSRFCDGCGLPLEAVGSGDAARVADAGAPQYASDARDAEFAGEGERRQLTVVFCDLVDSTELSQRLDPEDLRDVIRAFQETCAGVIQRFGGHVAQYLGDGLLVYFGYPQAHEDDAIRALAACLEIIEALPTLNSGLQERNPALREHPLQARAGIHTGAVVVAEMGDETKREQLALGDTTNLTARLQGIAEPDTVVLSEATRRLVEAAFVVEELGTKSLKGIAQPVAVCRAIRPSGVRRPVEAEAAQLTPFVGRADEIARLLDGWKRAKDGERQALLVRAEAGMGKTRLVMRLRECFGDEPYGWFECRCSAFHTNSVLYPVLESFKKGLRFGPEDSPEAMIAKLEQALRPSGFALAEVMPLFARLLSLPLPEHYPPIDLGPEAQRIRTFECLVTWLEKAAAEQPAVMLVEDVQWIDPSSLDLLGALLERTHRASLLVLLTARPDFRSPWEDRASIREVTLQPLTRQEMTAMVRDVATPRSLPAALAAEVVAKADGVPLFVEELTKAVLESEGFEEAGPRRDAEVSVPTTLRDSLMARLDRIGSTKEVAQLAAVLGREFSGKLLQAVSPLDPLSLEQELDRLRDAGLVDRSLTEPAPTYRFRHALIQEMAYRSLLRSRRREFHARVVVALEERFPERLASEPEVAAWHCEMSGQPERALAYYRQASERAMAASAHEEAIGLLTRAIELIGRLPESPERARQELALQVAVGVPLLAVKGYGSPDIERSQERARELCQGVDEGPELYQAVGGLFLFHLARAELPVAAELAALLLELGERANDRFARKWAHFFSGLRHYYVGEFEAALAHSEQAIALYEPGPRREGYVQEHDPDISARVYAAMSLSILGHPDRAIQRMDEALKLARKNASPWNLAFTLGFAAMFHHIRRESGLVLERAQESVEISKKQGFPYWLGMAMILRGWARAGSGVGGPALDEILRGIDYGASSGTRIGGSRMLGIVGEARRSAGLLDEAVSTLEAALAISTETGSCFWEAELQRLRGETLLERDPGAEAVAEECFERARAVAKAQNARTLELRAASSLARLRRRQGRGGEAAALLTEIYDWFQEGFDTPDLLEARELLVDLSRGVTPPARSA